MSVWLQTDIQQAICMGHIFICSLPRYTIFFLIMSQTVRFSKKKNYWTKKFILISPTKFVWNISHSKRTARYMTKNVEWFHVKYSLFLSDFNENWIFSMVFRKIFKYRISWKSVQWEPSCSVRTDMTQLKVAFRNFAKVSKNVGY